MTKAMILAAGRGLRMQHLTQDQPKPLLPLGGLPLIAHPLLALKKAGIDQIVINVSYKAKQIQDYLGSGQNFGVNIQYSYEPYALETGGGIYQALPLLGSDPFIVISADVWTDYPFEKLISHSLNQNLAHLILVKNPEFHLKGDFGLEQNRLVLHSEHTYTYASLGLYHPDLFQDCHAGIFPLIQVLKPAILAGKISGEVYTGNWANIGTPQAWESLNNVLKYRGI